MRPCLDHLVEVSHDAPRTLKWLVAPSFTLGHQWIETLGRAGQGTLNLRVTTPASLAMTLAGPQLVTSARRYLPAEHTVLLVERTLDRVLANDSGYLSKLNRSDSLTRALARALRDLRMAGVTSTQLRQAALESEAKHRDMTALLASYEKQLEELRLVDDAAVLELARRTVIAGHPSADKALVLLAPGAVRYEVEHRLIQSISQSQCILLRKSPPIPWKERGRSLEVFRALGEAVEVRESLRRLRSTGLELDRAELLHTDSATYDPLIRDIFAAIGADDEDLPVTFAAGLPATTTRPGRALRSWMRWEREGHRQETIAALIQNGMFRLGTPDAGFGFAALAGWLRRVGIGHGFERYGDKLRAAVRAQEQQVAEASETDEETDRADAVARRLEGLRCLESFFAGLPSTSNESSDLELLKSAQQLLTDAVRCVTSADRAAQRAMIERIGDMQQWLHRLEGSLPGGAAAWLERLPLHTSVLASGPQPGCLHVAPWTHGGHSARDWTVMIGLDDGRFPGGRQPEPVLLDDERRAISTSLKAAGEQPEQREQQWRDLLLQIPGHLTLAYSCRNIPEDREMHPSSSLISLVGMVREAEGREPLVDFEQWNRDVGPPVGFTPGSPQTAIDHVEAWQSWIATARNRATAGSAVAKAFPHLDSGRRAEHARSTQPLSAFNGFVPEATAGSTGMSDPLTASSLETLGRCPLAYYFRYLLHLRPTDDRWDHEDLWLDPASFGQLLHDVFRDFYDPGTETEEGPSFDRDAPRLERLLWARIQEYRDRIPPPHESAFRQQVLQLVRASRIFLMGEQDQWSVSRPVALEANLGLQAAAPELRSAFDHDEPVLIRLPGGGTLLAAGRVDRVDRLVEAPDRLLIWDYKTGSSSRFKLSDPFNRGRTIQAALYVALVRQAARQTLGQDVDVASFGYYFPNDRTWGERMHWSSEDLEEGLLWIQRMKGVLDSGLFLASDDKEDCSFCDFRLVCGDVEEVTARTKRLLDEPSGEDIIAPLRELRRDD